MHYLRAIIVTILSLFCGFTLAITEDSELDTPCARLLKETIDLELRSINQNTGIYSRSSKRVIVQGQSVQLPIGLSKESLEEMIQIFLKDNQFSKMEALVLFGSRTRFSYGKGPAKNSDLDVVIFGNYGIQAFEDQEIGNFQVRAINQKFKHIGLKSGFLINHLPNMWVDMSFDFILTQYLLKNKKTIEDMILIWKNFVQITLPEMEQDYLAKPLAYSVDPKTQLKELWVKTSGDWFNLEALIIMKGPLAKYRKTALQEAHYNNVLVVKSSK